MKVTIEQYLYMDHNAYKEMIKNKRKAIDITILPYDKYKSQTAEEIVEDLKRMEKQERTCRNGSRQQNEIRRNRTRVQHGRNKRTKPWRNQ